MTYGNKLVLVVFLLSLFLFIGCTSKNWSYNLYDDYKLYNIDNKTYLYKDNTKININDLDYTIIAFKYNSDVVCLKLNNNKYYMIYYVDNTIYGPYDLDSLNISISNLKMEFTNDFKDINKLEGKVYE